jgi:hypothetical protein
VERQNEQAKELLSALEQIKAAWEALPSEEEISDLAEKAGDVASCIHTAREQSDRLPSEDEINDLAEKAGSVVACLKEAREQWDNLPTDDQIGDLAKAAGNLAANLPDAEMASAKYLVVTSADEPDEAVPAATFAIFPALENAENYKRDMKKANPRCDVAIFRYAA